MSLELDRRTGSPPAPLRSADVDADIWSVTIIGRTTATSLALLCAATVLPAADPAAASPAPAAAVRLAAPAQDPVPMAASGVSTSEANDRLARVLPERTTSKILGWNFTMTVWDSQTRSFIYRKRAKKSLRGASTMKILTAVAVLATLGPDHRLPTVVRRGATETELIVVGGGDPLLTSANLRRLARRTAEALVAEHGDGSIPPITVRVDDSLFRGGGVPKGWSTGWVPSQVRRVGAFARDDRKVTDATADVGAYFAAKLRANDVPATYRGEARAEPDAGVVASYAGHTVGKAVSHALLVSDNDTAEMLFRQVAVARGEKASFPGARRAVRATLQELRVPLAGVEIVDGSGLSLAGRVTAPALSRALKRALSPKYPNLAGIRGWLPVAGAQNGTLQADYKRFTTWPSKCAAGLVQGKTGTLADAISLAGYAQGADGQTKIYVAIVNSRPTAYSRLTTRQAVDRPVSSITGCW